MTKLLRVGTGGLVEELDVAVGGAPSSALVTFGTAPLTMQTGTIAHVGATVGQRVTASVDGESDEVDLEPLTVSAWVSATDTISVRASTLNSGAFFGQRRINYQVG